MHGARTQAKTITIARKMNTFGSAFSYVQHRCRTSLNDAGANARKSAEHDGNMQNKVDAPVERLIVREQATADSQTSDGLWCRMQQGTHIKSAM